MTLPRIEDYRRQIEAALPYAHFSHTFDDIRDAVERGDMQFWPGVASVVITEIVDFPRYRACNVVAAGGNLAELKVMIPAIEQWARDRGCVRATFAGRRGWERTFLKDDGWEPNMVVMEKAL